MKTLCMGNEAIARGAMRAGVQVVTGYPGTPSSEILETVARHNEGDIYVEWSVNEKVALEVAAGASYAGQRTMVTMKQVGLNVASDPLMSLAYIGVKGGMVIVVADDPGPISSQTEQDTRHFGIFAKLPVFDPTTGEEAYEMIQDAFAYSERYETPVLLRPTTRICHSCISLNLEEDATSKKLHNEEVAISLQESPQLEVTKEGQGEQSKGFIKDSKWVIFPKLTYGNHLKIEARNEQLKKDFSKYHFNTLDGEGKVGILASGVSYTYTKEVLKEIDAPYKLLKVATPHPFPEALALQFLEGLEEVLVIEELDPVLERELLMLCGKKHLKVNIRGKLTHDTPQAGENSVDGLRKIIYEVLHKPYEIDQDLALPPLPVRPPVLCAGCPHRASFYAVKVAMKGKQAVFSGDIGCYTLGNAKPLDMVDTCLCMGAGITIAQGLQRTEPDKIHIAFVGDSTFFHTGIPGIINALYNETDLIVAVLDNATTAMTGNQPHPGLGETMMGEVSNKISIYKILEAIGVHSIRRVNPFKQEDAILAVQAAASEKGVRILLFEAPCVAISKSKASLGIEQNRCTKCKQCVRQLGCPALVVEDDKIQINQKLCTGCGLCQTVCPFHAIGGTHHE